MTDLLSGGVVIFPKLFFFSEVTRDRKHENDE